MELHTPRLFSQVLASSLIRNTPYIYYFGNSTETCKLEPYGPATTWFPNSMLTGSTVGANLMQYLEPGTLTYVQLIQCAAWQIASGKLCHKTNDIVQALSGAAAFLMPVRPRSTHICNHRHTRAHKQAQRGTAPLLREVHLNIYTITRTYVARNGRATQSLFESSHTHTTPQCPHQCALHNKHHIKCRTRPHPVTHPAFLLCDAQSTLGSKTAAARPVPTHTLTLRISAEGALSRDTYYY